jgi:hypothetical protein
MAPEEMAAVLWSPNQLCYNVGFFLAIFVNYFVHNVSATICYGRKELLDIRTAITRIRQRFFQQQQQQHQQQAGLTRYSPYIPIILKRKWHRGRRAGCLVRTRRRPLRKLPLLSTLLTNVQTLVNKLDKVRSRISYQRDIKNCNILCFTESWLNDDMDIQLAGYTLHRQDRTAHSSKTSVHICKQQLVHEI